MLLCVTLCLLIKCPKIMEILAIKGLKLFCKCFSCCQFRKFFAKVSSFIFQGTFTPLYFCNILNFKFFENIAVTSSESPVEFQCLLIKLTVHKPTIKKSTQLSCLLQHLERLSGPRTCLLYTSPSPRDQRGSRMPSSA